MSEQLLVDLDEAAARLSVSRRFIQAEIFRGRIRSVKAGRRRLVSEAALVDYVDQLEAENAPPLAVLPRRRSASG